MEFNTNSSNELNNAGTGDLTEEVIAELELPPCFDVSEYGRISEHWPIWFTVESGFPTFTWFYYFLDRSNFYTLEDWDSACVPERYTLHLSTGPEFDDELVFEITDPVITRDPTKLTLEWTLTADLEPLKPYRWMIVGHAGDLLIDDWGLSKLHDDEWWPNRSSYFESTFRTGPECPEEGVSTPVLIYPVGDVVIDTLLPELTWQVEGCMPTFFVLEISTLSTFGNPIDPTIASDPNTLGDYTMKRWPRQISHVPKWMLRDCTRYFWRVQGGFEHNNPVFPAVMGGMSEVGTFVVNLGECDTISQITYPTDYPTVEQYHPPAFVPTSTPAFTCWGLDEPTCKLHRDECEWFPTKTGGDCKPK